MSTTPPPPSRDQQAAADEHAHHALPDGMARALFEESPLSMVVYDGAGHVLATNAAFERLWSVRLGDVPPGYSVLTDPELDRHGIMPFVRRAFAGETVTSPPIRYDITSVVGGGEGRTVWTEGHFVPMLDAAGRVTRVVLTHVDLTERMHADQAFRESEQRARRVAEQAIERAQRLQRLQRVTADLNRAATVEQIGDVILDAGIESVGADAASLALFHPRADGGGTFTTIRSRGFTDEVAERYRRFPMTQGRPLSEAVAERRIITIASRAECDARYPLYSEDGRSFGYQALAAMPVMIGERAIAGITFSFRDPHAFDPEAVAFLETLAEQCALALERVRLHEAEMRLLERNAAILETIQDGFVALDAGRRFTYVNRRAEEMLRRSAAELLGRTVAEAFPGVDLPIVDAARRAVRERTPVHMEQYSPIVQRWLDVRVYPAGDGVSVFFQDVTERHRAQRGATVLAEASRLLASSLEYETTLRAVARSAVPELADWCAVDVITDPEAAGWPPVLEHIAVEHQDEARIALALRLRDEYPTNWAEDVGVARVLRTGEPMFVPVITDEMIVAGARDAAHLEILRSLRFSSIIVVPLIARGRTLGTVTLCMTESQRRYDETDLELAQQLAQRAAVAVDNARLFRDAQLAREEAEAANHAKTQFLATMSHELRTPLNAIAGYSELIELGVRGPVTAEQRADLERIRRSQRHLLSLVDDVLNLARIESRRMEYTMTDVRVASVIETVVSLIEPQAAARSLGLEVLLDDPDLAARADHEKLQQVVINLASNAVKFSDAGGRVTIAAAARGDVVQLAVRDTGRGIPADKLESIFEPFVQVESGLTRTVQGSGLGLAIARDLARGMGGDLTVESREGDGSTFTVTLPRVVTRRDEAA